MTTYLLANVGTRDVQLDTLEGIPAEFIANAKSGQLKARQVGEYLRQEVQFKSFSERIRLPMIDKALRFMAPSPGPDLRIVLFATDQDQSVQPFYRDNDTVHFAHLIRELLFLRHQRTGLAKKQIEIVVARHNPADYDLMHDFYRNELPGLARRSPAPDPAYLLIAGGTPQMNTMLLFVGSEVFGPATQPLYVSQESDYAHVLDSAHQLYLQAVCRNLGVVLDAYAYSSALDLLQQNVAYLKQDTVGLLHAALEYAIARRNLDLTTAARAFDTTLPSTRALRGVVQTLKREVEDQSEQAQLRETIFLAQIAARTGAWADFLNRLYRFSEGCMQLVAEREPLKVVWSDSKKRGSYAARWWEDNRALLATHGLASPTAPGDLSLENKAREVDRTNMRIIIAALATAPEHESIRRFLAALEVVDRPIPLRNDIVHRFTPVSKEEIERKAEVNGEELLSAMRQAYQHAFGIVVPEGSPYDTLNRLCADILKGQM